MSCGTPCRLASPDMLAHVTTFAIQGVDSRRVTVEVDLRPGLPAFTIVGLGDRAVRESRERVRSAILNSGFEFPARRITVNLAPAALRKEGPGFDLAIACGVLAAVGQLPAERPGARRRLRRAGAGRRAAPVPRRARGGRGRRARRGWRGLVLPAVHGRGGGAGRRPGRLRRGATSPRSRRSCAGESDGSRRRRDDGDAPAPARARARPRRRPRPRAARCAALAIAAAGGHNLLLAGPPGTGKTMLAQRLPSILPPLSRAEAIEVTRIQSVAGLRAGRRPGERAPVPRAAPHDLGRPGWSAAARAAARARRRWPTTACCSSTSSRSSRAPALEALRQPLEDGRVAIVRGQRTRGLPDALHAGGRDEPVPVRLRRHAALPLRRGRPRPLPPPAQRPAAGSHRPAGRRPAPDAARTSRPARSAARRSRARARRRRPRAPGGAAGRHRRGVQRPPRRARSCAATCALDAAAPRVLRRAYDRGTLSAARPRPRPARRAHDRRPRRRRHGRRRPPARSARPAPGRRRRREEDAA